MRTRWDPPYPPTRRTASPADASLRASDDERNDVADKLARHYAEGRLDETEFKARLDIAMSAVTRGELHGLFHDLPRLPSEPTPPVARHRRILPWLLVIVLAVVVAGVSFPYSPFPHVPWLLVALAAYLVWRRAGHPGGPFHPSHPGRNSRRDTFGDR